MRPRSWRSPCCCASICCDSCTRLLLDTMRSTRPTRASRSSSRSCTGSSFGVVAQPATSNAQTVQMAAFIVPPSIDVDDLDAPVLRPGVLVIAGRGRTFLAIADRGDLRFLHALQRQGAPHGLRATLGQADVVFARAALVAVTLEPHAHGGIAGQEPAMRGNHIDVFGADVAAVE